AAPRGLPQIDGLIGDAACTNDSECRVIGVGARACGGPEAYRAWSATRTDAVRLEALVAQDAAARRAEIERSGMLSTCDIKRAPTVSCVRPSQGAGRCTLEPAGGGSR
ncbi:MAG: hypothetical protein Q7T55_13830, partial [Solirubrobacteraceae bacterium]|nr:hypothetical protein [Solirubrobacteraceae bacterium]